MKTIEIERKFLIDPDKFNKYLNERVDEYNRKAEKIIQFYPYIDDHMEVRIRLTRDLGYMFTKYFDNSDLLSRREFVSVMNEDTCIEYKKYIFEHNIKCIEKYRYSIFYKGHLFEVDFFAGDNEGLYLAEVEIDDEKENIELPDFIIKEVTGDIKYYNKNLYINPYKNWK